MPRVGQTLAYFAIFAIFAFAHIVANFAYFAYFGTEANRSETKTRSRGMFMRPDGIRLGDIPRSRKSGLREKLSEKFLPSTRGGTFAAGVRCSVSRLPVALPGWFSRWFFAGW